MQFMVICTFCLPSVIAWVDDIIVKVSQFINRVLFLLWFMKFERTVTVFFKIHKSQRQYSQALLFCNHAVYELRRLYGYFFLRSFRFLRNTFWMAAIKAYSIAGFSIFNKSSSVVQDSHYLILSYRFRQTYMYTKECSVLVGREFKKKPWSRCKMQDVIAIWWLCQMPYRLSVLNGASLTKQ